MAAVRSWVWLRFLAKTSKLASRLVSTTCSNKTDCMKPALQPVNAKAAWKQAANAIISGPPRWACFFAFDDCFRFQANQLCCKALAFDWTWLRNSLAQRPEYIGVGVKVFILSWPPAGHAQHGQMGKVGRLKPTPAIGQRLYYPAMLESLEQATSRTEESAMTHPCMSSNRLVRRYKLLHQCMAKQADLAVPLKQLSLFDKQRSPCMPLAASLRLRHSTSVAVWRSHRRWLPHPSACHGRPAAVCLRRSISSACMALSRTLIFG